MKTALHKSLKQCAAVAQLQYAKDLPVDFVDATEVPPRNRLLSGVGKLWPLLRRAARADVHRNQPHSKTRCASCVRQQPVDLWRRRFRHQGQGLAPATRVLRQDQRPFTDFGGDSLSALTGASTLLDLRGRGSPRRDHQPRPIASGILASLHRDTAQQGHAASDLHIRSRPESDRDLGQRVDIRTSSSNPSPPRPSSTTFSPGVPCAPGKRLAGRKS